MTYLLMSLPFVGVALLVFLLGAVRARRRHGARRLLAGWAATTAALLVLTAVFDNVMMAVGFFDYGPEAISGARIWLIPLEDFLYPLAGALLLSGAWELFGGAQTRGERHDR